MTTPPNPAEMPEVYCTFCGKKSDEVRLTIQGENANICVGCVMVCLELVNAQMPPVAPSPAEAKGEVAEAVEYCSEYLKRFRYDDYSREQKRAVCVGFPIEYIETLIKAATEKQEPQGDLSYEYLPGDATTKLTEAWEILDRVTDKVRARDHSLYEPLAKVREIFRKHIKAATHSQQNARVEGLVDALIKIKQDAESNRVWAGIDGWKYLGISEPRQMRIIVRCEEAITAFRAKEQEGA